MKAAIYSASLCDRRMVRGIGTRAGVKAEETLSQTQQNSSHGVKGSKGHINPSREKEDATACSGNSQSMVQPRILRSHYHALKTSIAEERENILKAESGKFESIISKVESLHNLVQRPREQVADAETLFDLTSTLLATVKRSQNSDGATPVDFISDILRSYSDQAYGSRSLEGNDDQNPNIMGKSWAFSCFCFPGCSRNLHYVSVNEKYLRYVSLCSNNILLVNLHLLYRLGPMDNEPKQRKVIVQRKRTKPTESTRPEAVGYRRFLSIFLVGMCN